ncbi:S8 family serine peptidase [Leptospira kanakyensis]|uniref:S8 family serine peptidase n=1 Tax=Leptospira kanakyensis TaxID=2484968 RepID=UPI002AC8466C|nr:S8 family serine peptidase [Leptospira kanakyensis]
MESKGKLNNMKTMVSRKAKLKILILMVLVGSTVLVSDPIQRDFLSEPFRFQNLPLSPISKLARTNKPDYASDEIVIKFKANVSNEELFSRSKSLGFNVNQVSKRAHFTTVRIANTETVEDAVYRAKSDPAVEYAEPKYYYYAQATAPNDTYFDKLWGLKNYGQPISSPSYTTNNPGTDGNDMNVLGAWDVTTNCSSIIVAVLDTGINYDHEDLTANMWDGTASCKDKEGATIGGGCPKHGWDFASNDNDPKDEDGHGSHVAGTIGAVGNNNKGITGVCQSAKLMSVRVLGANGGSNDTVADGIYFAVRNGAKVINMSLGGTQYSGLIYDAVEYAKANDVLVVVAAGNENTDLSTGNSYPCKNNNTNQICIAALDQNYQRATFSNYDTNATAANRTVDFGAPGTNIYSIFGLPQFINEHVSGYNGWTSTGSGTAWSSTTCTTSSLKMLTNPDCTFPNFGFDGSAVARTKVALNTSTIMYKTFNLAANTTKVSLLHYVVSWGESGSSPTYTCYDYMRVRYSNTAGSPALGTIVPLYDQNRGKYVEKLCGSTNLFESNDADIPVLASCGGSTQCTIGYEMVSDGSVQKEGGFVTYLYLDTWAPYNIGTYGLYNGTSMATPNVAGVAALIRAYNPLLNNAEVIQKLIDGGSAAASIASITKYGKSINANDSVKHLNQVTGVTATLQ